MLKKKKLSVSGNRTPVSRELQAMTGGDTYHYTNTDLLVRATQYIDSCKVVLD